MRCCGLRGSQMALDGQIWFGMEIGRPIIIRLMWIISIDSLAYMKRQTHK